MSRTGRKLGDDLPLKIKYIKSLLSGEPESVVVMNKIKYKDDLQYYKELIILSNKVKTLKNIKTIARACPIYMNIVCGNKDKLTDKNLYDLVTVATDVAIYFSKLNLTLDDITIISDDYHSYSDLSILSRQNFGELYRLTKNKMNNFISGNPNLLEKLRPIREKIYKMNNLMQGLSKSSEEMLIDFIYPGNIISKLAPNLKIKN